MSLEPAHALELLRQMLLIRHFEERCAEAYSAGSIRGFLHLYIGEEAVAAGCMAALRAEDNVVATYREHGHALLRGTPALAVMAEMYGRSNGCSRGRGGSMHLFDIPRRLYGGNAIVGGGLPLAAGLALADKMQGRDAITSCFFGDGAADEGEFYETLNLCALWRLPVLFICENNQYAMGTALARHQAVTDLCVKARAHGIPAESVDGMDVVAVEAAVRHAASEVRRTRSPFFVEALTYRFRAHSMYDAELYRSRAEVREWSDKHDPIANFRVWLRARDWLDDDRDAALERAVKEEIDAAVAGAEQGPLEPVEALLEDVYAEAEA